MNSLSLNLIVLATIFSIGLTNTASIRSALNEDADEPKFKNLIMSILEMPLNDIINEANQQEASTNNKNEKQQEPNYLPTWLNQLPKKSMFKEASLVDVPEEVTTPDASSVKTSTSSDISSSENDFLTKLMNLSQNHKEDKQFLAKLMNLFLKRSLSMHLDGYIDNNGEDNEPANYDTDDKRSNDFDNIDFGSLHYMGKRRSPGRLQATTTTSSYHTGYSRKPFSGRHFVDRNNLSRLIGNKPSLSPIGGFKQPYQITNKPYRREIDIDTLKFLADLQI